MRYKQVRNTSSGTTTTHYVGKLFEVEIKGSARKYTTYISDVAIKTSTEGTKFTLKDRLGSTTTITNDMASDITYRNFDVFGKPRDGGGRRVTYAPYGSKLSQYSNETTRLGFTDHEHLDEVELICMNGRIYDYNVGRFLSVDPFVHEGSQGINPYSYIMNNPLSGTDPTGYKPKRLCGEESTDGCKVITDKKQIKQVLKQLGTGGNGAKSNEKNSSAEDTGSQSSRAKRDAAISEDVYEKNSKLNVEGVSRLSFEELQVLGIS